MTTKVVFRKWNDGEVIALFPDIPFNTRDYTTISYEHRGQHGAADYSGVIARTTPATEPEYRDLLAELRFIGYKELYIVKRARPKFHEIK